MQKLIISLLILSSSCFSFAQSQSREIRISLKDESKIPVHSASVHLLNGDSVLLKMTTSDNSGIVIFNGLPAGKYRLQVTHTGYQHVYPPAIDLKNEAITSFDIILKGKRQH